MHYSVKRILTVFFIGLPVLSLIISVLSWLRFGLDLPFVDDWRGYHSGRMHSLDFDYLFHPVNDTLTPVGFALDALAQRYLDGNSIAYQFLSMILVLGGLLLLQWKLLLMTLNDRFFASICFSFTLLMLQPDSYWGQQNMAYHQALPILFLFAAFYILLHTSIKIYFRIPAITLLGILASLSYISGAFATLVAGLGLILFYMVARKQSFMHRYMEGGLLLSLVGLVLTLYQFNQSVPGFTTHRSDAPMAFPNSLDYWMFLFGKIGRALFLSQNNLEWSLFVVIVFILAIIGFLVGFYYRLIKFADYSRFNFWLIFSLISFFVFIYLLIIAAGRANLRPSYVSESLDVFSFGFNRFHFFWVTVLVPWLVGALLLKLFDTGKSDIGNASAFISLPFLAVVLLLVYSGVLRHWPVYKQISLSRAETISCLAQELQRNDSIYCFELNMPDFRPAYNYARTTNASFIRYFPVLPVPLGSIDPPALLRYSLHRDLFHFQNFSPIVSISDYFVPSSVDPNIFFSVAPKTVAETCKEFEISASLSVDKPDFSQLFYRFRGINNFDEQSSKKFVFSDENNPLRIIRFSINSDHGFEPEFRLDPVASTQPFKLNDIEIRCRQNILK